MSDKLDNPVTGKPNIAAPPAHDHGKDANSRMLVFALILTSTFLVVEVIGSFVFNSLALLSYAGHMLTDVAALAIALMAIRKIGRAHVSTPVTNAHLVCRLLLEKKNILQQILDTTYKHLKHNIPL